MTAKILSADGGETTCCVIRAAEKMDIRTMAARSDADREAPKVREAEEAMRIGLAP